MKTAVEWLVEQILQKVRNYEDDDIETEEEPFIIEYVNKYHFTVDLTKFVKQAKEMEKQQIIDAFDYACSDEDMIGVEYYNETFKSE